MPPQSLLVAPAPPRATPVPRPAAPNRLHGLTWLYGLGCAVFALLLALTTSLTPHRIWGLCAALGYVVAAGFARRASHLRQQRAAWAALAGAVVLPLLVLIAVGAAQSEVHVVENSGSLQLHSGSPYRPHPTDVGDYNPYLPGTALFGLPRALLGATPLADARLWFAAVFLAAMVVAARCTAGSGERPERSADAELLLAAFPAVALPLAVGGVDLPVIGLMCLGLALAGRGGSGTAAGLAMGAAAALKWTAWPLLPVGLVLLATTAGRGRDPGSRRIDADRRPGRGARSPGEPACLRRACGALPVRPGDRTLAREQPPARPPAGRLCSGRPRIRRRRAGRRRSGDRSLARGPAAPDGPGRGGPPRSRPRAGHVPDPGDPLRLSRLPAGARGLVPPGPHRSHAPPRPPSPAEAVRHR